MNEAAPAPVVVDGGAYAVRLPVFDGPLELLLHLIRKDELDIFDIPISRLTAAYLVTLDEMRRHGIEPASEFLLMAATLLQIKSRMLLPRPPAVDDIDEGLEDPRAALVQQLLEYQRFREVAVAMDGLAMVGRDVFLRTVGLDRPADEEGELAALDVYRLAEAFRELLARGQFEAPHDIYVERISIGERIAQIADVLAVRGRTTFASLCVRARYREEVITTFLALLEMARLKLIRVTQGESRGPVYVEARVGAIGELGEQAAGMLGDDGA
ncbi:MAG: segregation/condensation protein A [Myxococcales bacterium]|nr:segregation/condensation protein A [Myxococcales bacterium]